MSERTCITCKYWNFHSGEPDYSTLTQGSDWSSYCGKQKWFVSGHRATETEYRKALLTAVDCELYDNYAEKTPASQDKGTP